MVVVRDNKVVLLKKQKFQRLYFELLFYFYVRMWGITSKLYRFQQKYLCMLNYQLLKIIFEWYNVELKCRTKM